MKLNVKKFYGKEITVKANGSRWEKVFHLIIKLQFLRRLKGQLLQNLGLADICIELEILI
jgi:hypothetical protein